MHCCVVCCLPLLNFAEEGSYGALFETGILILRHEAGQLFAAPPPNDHTHLKHFKYNNGRYSSPRRPMTMMSGVLESSRQALSIWRIFSLIGRSFANRLGQKGG